MVDSDYKVGMSNTQHVTKRRKITEKPTYPTAPLLIRKADADRDAFDWHDVFNISALKKDPNFKRYIENKLDPTIYSPEEFEHVQQLIIDDNEMECNKMYKLNGKINSSYKDEDMLELKQCIDSKRFSK